MSCLDTSTELDNLEDRLDELEKQKVPPAFAATPNRFRSNTWYGTICGDATAWQENNTELYAAAVSVSHERSISINSLSIVTNSRTPGGVGLSGHVKMGIYTDVGAFPGELIVTTGEVTPNDTGLASTASVSVTLSRGTYWMTMVTYGTWVSGGSSCSLRAYTGTHFLPPVAAPTRNEHFFTSASLYGVPGRWQAVLNVGNDLPATFPDPPDARIDLHNNQPVLYYRVSGLSL